jgi:putative FmdB family regulatory protein
LPLYEYECRSCKHRFEKIVKFSDPPLTTCPACGQESVEQLLSAPAVQFKGSGWYVTDYAKKGSGAKSSPSAKGGDVEASASSKSEAKDSAKSESPKPAPEKK